MTIPAFPDKPRRPSRASQRSSVNYSLPISPAKPIIESSTSQIAPLEKIKVTTVAPAPRRATVSQVEDTTPTPSATTTTTSRRTSVGQSHLLPPANRRASISQATSLTPAPRRATISQPQPQSLAPTSRRTSISQVQSLTPAPRRMSVGQGQGLTPAPRRGSVSQAQGLTPAPRRGSVSQGQPTVSRRGSAWAPLSATAEDSNGLVAPAAASRASVNAKRLSVRGPLASTPAPLSTLSTGLSVPLSPTKRLGIAPLNTSLPKVDDSEVPASPTRNWAPLSPSFGKLASSLPPSPNSPNGRTWGPLATPPEGSNKLSVPPSPGGSQLWAPLATPTERSHGLSIPPSPNREYGNPSSKRVSTMPIGINFSHPNSPAKSAFSAESRETKNSEVSSFSPYGSTTDQLTTFANAKGEKEGMGELPYSNSDQSKRGSRHRFANRKWISIGLLLLLLVLGGVGAGVYILLSHKKTTNSSNGVAGVVQSDPNDPSIFVKDPALKQSFYGMAYTPQNARYPTCEDGIEAVTEDIQLLSQLTTRLRIYGSDCDQASLVLEAIQRTKVNMTVFLTAWLPQVKDDPNGVIYQRQVDGVVTAIQNYGTSNIGGILIGNEVSNASIILHFRFNTNSPLRLIQFLMTGGVESVLISRIAQMKNTLASMNLDRMLPVGTADTGAAITTTLSQASDFILANIHSWFAGVTVDTAAAWIHNFASTGAPSSAALATNQPTVSSMMILASFELPLT